MASPDPDEALDSAATRCLSLLRRVASSPKLPPPLNASLRRLIAAELRSLLLRPRPLPCPLSSNLGHLEAVFHVVLHPAVHGVSRVARPLGPVPVHVDVACSLRRAPAWVFVSDRNPSRVSWRGSPGERGRGVRARVAEALAAARAAARALRPEKLLFVFARGVGDGVAGGLVEEFGAAEIGFFDDLEVFEELDSGWMGVRMVDSELLQWAESRKPRVFEIDIRGEFVDVRDRASSSVNLNLKDEEELDLSDPFSSLISKIRPNCTSSENVINFDTTAMIALVSGISNGGAEQLLKGSENEMRARFKSNYDFVIMQAKSELQHPILPELENVIAGKKGIVCQSVCSEFKEIASMCGGPSEKIRADKLVKRLLVVPDSPSMRLMDLPTTRKLALKNKIVFGTGDHWRAPTLTANMGFVRAVSQTSMSLLTIEHRPRALIGI
ncbi:UPF0415 protein C7orf25 homolog [Ananas comosus]|uniref:UPF0415 protein C7orf25 homolog n=1 Tax=Ananas comosus TaxID=4615 RepID=A0A6P5FJJ5_ANACO|nr:UPF0415 protein C7orf25 homolog [Ananas comosus]